MATASVRTKTWMSKRWRKRSPEATSSLRWSVITSPTKYGRPQLAKDTKGPRSKTMISALSSSLRSRAAHDAPPATPPTISTRFAMVCLPHPRRSGRAAPSLCRNRSVCPIPGRLSYPDGPARAGLAGRSHELHPLRPTLRARRHLPRARIAERAHARRLGPPLRRRSRCGRRTAASTSNASAPCRSRRCGAARVSASAWPVSRSSSIRCGWTIRASSSPTTCATPPCRSLATCGSSSAWRAASSPRSSTRTGRSGRCGSSKASRAGASRSSPRSITA